MGPKPKPFHYMDQVTSLCHRLVAQTSYKIFFDKRIEQAMIFCFFEDKEKSNAEMHNLFTKKKFGTILYTTRHIMSCDR